MLAVHKSTLLQSAFFGVTGVIVLALGAHALEARLDAQSLNSVETAGLIQLIHAVVLLGLAQLSQLGKYFRWASLSIFWGTLLFSGSIYLLVFFKPIVPIIRHLWPITPLGGMILIAGWLLLLKGGLSIQHNGKP